MKKYKVTVYEITTDSDSAGHFEQIVTGDDGSIILHVDSGAWKVTTNDIVNMFAYGLKEGLALAKNGYESIETEFKSQYISDD